MVTRSFRSAQGSKKHYYRVAERKNRRRAMHRVDRLFAMLEQTGAGMKQYSIC